MLSLMLKGEAPDAGGYDTSNCVAYLYPQSAGYGFDAQGVQRLHFVGRLEHLAKDWSTLTAMLLGKHWAKALYGQGLAPQSFPQENRRSNRASSQLAFGGIARQELRIRIGDHLLWDDRCLTPMGGRLTARAVR